MVDLAVVAETVEVAVALEVDLGPDDEQVDAILDRQDPGDQAVQSQIPSVAVRVVATVEVVLGEVERLWVDKALYSHQTADVVGVDADVAAAAAGLVVQQSDRHAATCTARELQRHDGVQQPVLLPHGPCPLLLWPCDEPTIQPYFSNASHYEGLCAWGRLELLLLWLVQQVLYRRIQA